ncbi:MAG TPA: endolytic transglycosylase MltG, partial [Candidatus Acidoferrales bacterium]|nr:endolytic transglycosylase MltG [Candidatus Acidoferrales bacterium]
MRRLGLLALLVIAAIGAGAGWLDSQISRPYRGHRPEKVFVDIPHGKSRWSIAGILRQNDVIRDRLAFALFSFWHIRTPMEAGEYYFDHPVTSREVFWQLALGKIFVHTVTIPEGWTMFDIADELDR